MVGADGGEDRRCFSDENLFAQLATALERRPDDALVHYHLGLCLLRLGHTDEAVRHLREALRLKPDFTAAHDALDETTNNPSRRTTAPQP